MEKKHRYLIGLALIGAFGLSSCALATDLSGVPGVVIHHMKLGSYGLHSSPGQFISDPEILVLANGDYVAAHALAGRDSNSDTSGTTYLFKSTDKGASWSSLGSTLSPLCRGSLVEHGGALYIIGATQDANSPKMTIWKSTDNGANWVSPLVTDLYGTSTPCNPFVYSNRVWASSGQCSVFASTSADWMDAASWSRKGGFPAQQPEWRSGDADWIGEGQIAGSSALGVFVLPMVRDHALLARASVDPVSGDVSFDPDHDFSDFPGGDKKFGAAYDAVSGKFYALSNPILAVDKGEDTPNLIRNTTALLSSPDLRNWNVEKIFQYTEISEDQGFCYPNFDFDGTNMVIATRGAYKVGDGRDPQRAHDSNLLVFNVIKDFRHATPDQYLTRSGGDVLRCERTEDEDAPLGSFALGDSFAGSPITDPDGLGQDTNGDVYIRESGGRILRFDAAGNFIDTTNSSPVSFQASDLDVKQPNGFATWTKSGSGDWSVSENWFYWRRADTKDEIAVFGSAITAPATITAHNYLTEWEIKGIRFRNSQTYTLAGDNKLTIKSDSGNASIEVQEGSHEIQLPVDFKSDVDFSAQASNSLTISSNEVDLADHTLNVNSGLLSIEGGAFSMDGGALTMNGGDISFDNSKATFNGRLEFKAPENFTPEAGDSFHVLEGELHEGMFDQIVLPVLKEGLAWNTNSLYTSGDISVIKKVPEAWMAAYGLPTDGSADFVDSDGDTQDNYDEWYAGTDPTNALSYFDFDPSGSKVVPSGVQLRWPSLTNRTYRIEFGTNLLDNPALTELTNGVFGEEGVTDFIDTNATNLNQGYYRVYVE